MDNTFPGDPRTVHCYPEPSDQSDQIQIKMAQGTKPGEGGELTDSKVSTFRVDIFLAMFPSLKLLRVGACMVFFSSFYTRETFPNFCVEWMKVETHGKKVLCFTGSSSEREMRTGAIFSKTFRPFRTRKDSFPRKKGTRIPQSGQGMERFKTDCVPQVAQYSTWVW